MGVRSESGSVRNLSDDMSLRALKWSLSKMQNFTGQLAEILIVGCALVGALGAEEVGRSFGKIVGNCDERDECVVNVGVSDFEWRKLCDSPDLSVHWTRGQERYLVQCRSGGTSDENMVWIVDLEADIFGRLHFGRFFKKSVLEGRPNLKIPDKFQSRDLCRPVDVLRVRVSDFILLDKKPTGPAENPYCYDPVYLSVRGGRLTVGTNDGPFKSGDADHSVHSVLTRERAHLNHLLASVRRWHPESSSTDE